MLVLSLTIRVTKKNMTGNTFDIVVSVRALSTRLTQTSPTAFDTDRRKPERITGVRKSRQAP